MPSPITVIDDATIIFLIRSRFSIASSSKFAVPSEFTSTNRPMSIIEMPLPTAAA